MRFFWIALLLSCGVATAAPLAPADPAVSHGTSERGVDVWGLMLSWGVATAMPLVPADPVASHGTSERFERGVDAYRRGQFDEAERVWKELFETEDADAVRAQLAYDLGNATFRQEKVLEAIGWYTACLRLAPRHTDAWRNLELARSEAGLDPADRGDLRATVERLLTSLTEAEARFLALCGLLAFALAAAFEVVFGGRTGRGLLMATTLLAVACALPWGVASTGSSRDPVLVIERAAVALRSEPRTDLDPIADIEPGTRVERIDSLPGWVRVQLPSGTRGWVKAGAVFALEPRPAKTADGVGASS